MKEEQANWNLDNSYHQLSNIFYTKQKPTQASNPELILFNDNLAASLGLNDKLFKTEAGVNILSGNELPAGADPLAQAYAGHQFGQFTMLGDGRAILLGEQITPEQKRFDIQLKGAGKTTYSRGGDGRGALGPMLREYIISEAMHALKVPTTRALAVTKTGNPIYRERVEDGAVLTRVSASHIRVGTFQYAAAWGTTEELQQLADYTIERHYPHIIHNENPYLSLLEEVIKRQAKLIAEWQLIGFVHGVMNTDNMTISGETIDYGPCAFIDVYDPKTVFSSIDREGRYRYENQPAIGAWNLTRFAETLIPLINKDEQKAIEQAKTSLMTYKDCYEAAWLSGMRAKLGLIKETDHDQALIKELLTIMEKEKLDYTNTFIDLTNDKRDEISTSKAFQSWYKRWRDRLQDKQVTVDDIKSIMKQNNPSIIPRNYYVEQALAAASDGDYSVIKSFLKVLSEPYAYSEAQQPYRHIPKSFTHYQTFCGT